jgi:integrase
MPAYACVGYLGDGQFGPHKHYRPPKAGGHLATLRSMFSHVLRWQPFDGRNAAASPGMLREVHRDRYLTAAETQALLIVTGARKSEALLATWDLVDFDRGMLTVLRSKNGRPRHIPLSSVAVAILRRQACRRVPDNPHVFPSRLRPKLALENLRGAWARAKARGRAASRPAHPRPAALVRVGTGERRHAAVRDRHAARPPPAGHHHPLRPPRAAAPGGDGVDRGPGVEFVARPRGSC